jgi:hypothetical protein
MKLATVASDDEHEEQNKQASQANNLPAVPPDWRHPSGVDRIRPSSAAANYAAQFHNSALLFRSMGLELLSIEDFAEQITAGRPGLAYDLADIHHTLVESWKCKMAQYLNCGRP